MSDIINDLKNAPATFSSWDSCMSKAYCKWPAIVGIIVGGLIILSILWCVASCLCCGATLCGSCVRCLTCFGCCGACGSGRGSSRRHKDDYSQMPPTPYNGYQPQPAQMSYVQQAPQYAQFDAPTKGAKIHADSLPAMPSWDTATNRRVEDHSEPAQGYGQDVEMGRMTQPTRATRNGYSQVPNQMPVSPMSPPLGGSRFDGQGYNSDLGAQRMPQHDHYDDFTPNPISPAPTYTSNPQFQNGVVPHTDRFVSGAMSPTPREYNQPHTIYPQSSKQQIPYSPPASTRYEASDYTTHYPRAASPPPMQPLQQHNEYDQYQDSQSARPPSLLQIGRKPVTGSRREL